MSITDQQLRAYIDHIFTRYDRDRSGSLSANQLVFFFNDLFQMMNNPRRVNQWEAEQALRQIDLNNDGQASKQQLFLAFKQILGSQPQQQYGGYSHQNQGWSQQPQHQSGWGNQQQSGWGNQPPQNQGWGNNQGWSNQPPNQGWGNQPNNSGWGQPNYNQGWGQQPQHNCSGWGNQGQNYQKNWGSSSGW